QACHASPRGGKVIGHTPVRVLFPWRGARGILSACTSSHSDAEGAMDRRDFVGTVAASAAASSLRPGAADAEQQSQRFALEEVPVAQLQEWLTSGRTTSARLVAQYAGRIAALDQRGPRLGHVLQVNPEAGTIAAQLDAERRSGHVRGPMHG